MTLPHSLFPCPNRRRTASSTPSCRAGYPQTPSHLQPIENGRPVSAFIAEKSFEEEDIGVDLGGGDEPSTEVATSGGAGRTKRWAGGTPPLRPNRGGGLLTIGETKGLSKEVPALDGK